MIDFRNWVHNEVRVNKSDLGNITSARQTFKKAEEDMLPRGMVVDDHAAFVPLANLLEHTLTRCIIYLGSLSTCTMYLEQLVFMKAEH